ncbi:hypothetical protein BDQ12DRAFT_504936 [Crucibulum laeve]|uniref:Uncharacterized protein n=1 Tax=Crucibulum laeve TaxID=68775 RepID=A0A5C3LGT2_9AGAR|nr:hypothetical protein BDQ12DRAFT_504936 [Crucibulum laeve]
MENELPLKIRADIRDLWNSPTSSIQHSVKTLSETLGHKIIPQIQWLTVWTGLKAHFPDKNIFVPTICSTVTAWYDRLLWRLEQEVFSEWTEEFLTLLAVTGCGFEILLMIELDSSTVSRPQTSWKKNMNAFYLTVPIANLLGLAQVEVGFDKDFDHLMSVKMTEDNDEDEWSDIRADVTPSVTRTEIPRAIENPEVITPSRLPLLDTLARPSDLLASVAPYMLIVDATIGLPLTVQCSHEAGLELLANYLKKWARVNIQDSLKRPLLKIELIESWFCSGVMDTISIEPLMNHRGPNLQFNPTIILAFIEGVLGYKMVNSTAYRWIYKSDIPVAR